MNGSENPSLRLAEAVRLFNAGRYLDSHEAFEELWEGTHGERADLYKGFLQAAIALYHFQEGNLAGARKLYSGHRRYLASYLPEREGLDIESFLAEMQAFLGPALRAHDHSAIPFDLAFRPQIRSSRATSSPAEETSRETGARPERPS